MHRHRNIAFIIAIFSLMLSLTLGCSDDNNGTGPDNTPTDSVVVSIENVTSAKHGEYVGVSVTISSTTSLTGEMGGFDFLIEYDTVGLSLESVQMGQLLQDWRWEYCVYYRGAMTDCAGVPCSNNFLRVLIVADMGGAPSPSTFSGSAGQLVNLIFLVSDDVALDCTRRPIRFYWYDCGDQNISSKSGVSTYLSHYVYEYNGVNITADSEFPTYHGAPDTCGSSVPARTPRLITYRHGGVTLGCPAGFDTRGDINGNGIGFEIADAILYRNTLIDGFGVLSDSAASTAASDINADGNVWTLADFVYLERVVVGDGSAYPPSHVDTVDATVLATIGGGYSVSGGGGEIGAALLYIEGNVTPTLEASNMDMYYSFDGVNTRILVYSLSTEGFTGSFLTVSGNLVSIEMATYDGDAVNVSVM